MSTDKCQYCGAPKCVHTPFWFECGTRVIGDQSQACKARVAHAETLKKLVLATGILSKLIPYLRHSHPRCVSLCECGLREIIMEAGEAVNAAKEKGGAS